MISCIDASSILYALELRNHVLNLFVSRSHVVLRLVLLLLIDSIMTLGTLDLTFREGTAVVRGY